MPGEWSGEFAGVNAKVPPGGISTSLLRSTKLGLSAEAWRWFVKTGGKARLFTGRTGEKARKRDPRRGRPDVFYARVARRYAQLQRFRNVVERIARERKESPERVRDMILTARRRGLLTNPPTQGKRGGVLTRKGQALLRRKAKRR